MIPTTVRKETPHLTVRKEWHWCVRVCTRRIVGCCGHSESKRKVGGHGRWPEIKT